jgi:hypothetical protein
MGYQTADAAARRLPADHAVLMPYEFSALHLADRRLLPLHNVVGEEHHYMSW